MQITAKNVVHHSSECLAFVLVGTFSAYRPLTSFKAYGLGKVSYLASQKLLESVASNYSQNTRRSISWFGGLLVAGAVLYKSRENKNENKRNPMQIPSKIYIPAIKLAGITLISLGLRALCDRAVKRFS